MVNIVIIFNLSYAVSHDFIFQQQRYILPNNSNVILLTKQAEPHSLHSFSQQFQNIQDLKSQDIQIHEIFNYSHAIVIQRNQQITDISFLLKLQEYFCYQTTQNEKIFVPSLQRSDKYLSQINYLGCQFKHIKKFMTDVDLHINQIINQQSLLPNGVRFQFIQSFLQTIKFSQYSCSVIEIYKQLFLGLGPELYDFQEIQNQFKIKQLITQCQLYLKLKVANPIMENRCVLSMGKETYIMHNVTLQKSEQDIRNIFMDFKTHYCDLLFIIVKQDINQLILLQFYSFIGDMKFIPIQGYE